MGVHTSAGQNETARDAQDGLCLLCIWCLLMARPLAPRQEEGAEQEEATASAFGPTASVLWKAPEYTCFEKTSFLLG